jgi:DNA-binding transcriptional MerR regulator
MGASTYSIKEIEHLSGIKAHTLRIWEQRYNILQPKRTETNIRYYDDNDLRLVLNISLLNENGYKISKIAKMPYEEMRHIVYTITSKSNKIDEQIQALTLSMVELDEAKFEHIIQTNTERVGFEKMMVQIILPFLHRIGFLWITETINPAQEHFITNLIRQKLIVAIDHLKNEQKPQAKCFMIYLPENELHELSLLFANYLIRKRGHKSMYLGQSLPMKDLLSAYNVHKPEYIFSIFTTSPPAPDIQQYVNELSKSASEANILLTGHQVLTQDLKLPQNVCVIYRIEELIEMLENI